MYKKLILLALVWTWILIMLGAYVRLSDAGLGCPDWPGCYGQLSVPETTVAVDRANALYPTQPLEKPKAWKEMVHRYVAGGLGLLIFIIIALAIKNRRCFQKGIGLPLLLGGVLLLQAALGMWTVTLLLKPAIVTAHLLGGMLTFVLLTLLYARQGVAVTFNKISSSHSALFLAKSAWVVLFLQIALGGWVSSNYAALACYDFPHCQGAWIPPMDFRDAFHLFRELGMTAQGTYLSYESMTAIHWLHRVGALIVSSLLILLSLFLWRDKGKRLYAGLLGSLLVVQLGLGIANVLWSLPLGIAVAHNGVAALLLAWITWINVRLSQKSTAVVPSVGGNAKMGKQRKTP